MKSEIRETGADTEKTAMEKAGMEVQPFASKKLFV